MSSDIEILIADDDPVVRHILSSILESAHYGVIQADCGAECIRILESCAESNNVPQVLFLDLMLGDMTGADVLKKIRCYITPEQMPVALLSANPKEEMLSVDPELSPEFFLEKPFVPDAVLSIVKQALQND